MKKNVKLIWLLGLALLACTLMLAACDSGKNPPVPAETTSVTTSDRGTIDDATDETTAGNDAADMQAPETEAHVHTFGEWEIVKNATCVEEGGKERYCACGETQTGTVAAIGHAFGEWTTTKEPTCTEDGSKERVCACGDKETQNVVANGHTYGSWKTTQDATCTESGSKERVCACGNKETQNVVANGHTYGSWKTTQGATCTESGSKERRCSCGEKETQIIAATGHSWVAATCTDAKICSACKRTEGAALGHTTTNGLCTRCKQQIYIANSCTFVCTDSLPKIYNGSTYYEYTYGYDVPHAKTKISGMTSKVTAMGNVELVFECEITYLWKINRTNLSVQIIDSDGYTVYTGLISAMGNVTTGTKYKSTVTVYSQLLNKPGEYRVNILEN